MAEIVNSPEQVNSSPRVSHKHSTFPIAFDNFDTHQFGYIRPHLSVLGVPSDSFRYRPIVKTRSYSLKAPLMQDVFRKLTYFKVNLDAVLPLNAEKVYTNPVIGGDVSSFVNCCHETGYKAIKDAFSALLSKALTDFTSTPNAATTTEVIKALVFGELFYSRGSLLASLGCHLFPQFTATLAGVNYDYDDFFDRMLGEVLTAIGGGSIVVTIDGVAYYVQPSLDLGQSNIPPGRLNFREFLSLIRETSDWFIQSVEDSVFASMTWPAFSFSYSVPSDAPFNFQRVASYQLVCAEFFTNDHVDYIYSAELYRQYIGDLLRQSILDASGDAYWPYDFTLNGVNYQYDYLSGEYLAIMLGYVINSPSYILSTSTPYFMQYFISLFGLKRSLRYKDYFVSSRTRPLSVGDVNVSVNSNLVNVVDVTRKIQLQRFLNVVNHTGRRLSNYVKTLFGVDIKPDRHVPQYLAELSELVYTSEVENTGANQLIDGQTVTAVFSGNSSNKELEFGIDLQSCIIGVTTYDIERAFTHSIDRDFFIKDRFDMFVPELQFVGDQPVYKQELDSSDTNPFGSSFGYQYRDMQWKMIYSRASGGFVSKLPGFAFVNRPRSYNGDIISPDYIRCFPSEFDNFFVSLTGYSLGNYFHFIVWTKNLLEASRPMIANPTILE